jgi:L-lysine 2,3-aminomutase
MAHIVTLNTPSREDWLTQLADVVTSPDELLHLLNVDADANLLAGREANASSPCAPRAFIARMEKGNPDPCFVRYLPRRMSLFQRRVFHRSAGRTAQRGARSAA